MAKFKVGDIIKANKESNKKYRVTNQKNGWTGKVTSEENNGLIYVKTLTPEENEGSMYTVDERYFDLVQNNQIRRHIVNKNTVIVILDDGRKGVAKCSPDDKFNLSFGTALAVARAYGDKETEAKLLSEPSEPVKEKPTFKVGELVRIRQWDDMVKEFGTRSTGSVNCKCYFTKRMKPLCGKYAEITKIRDDGKVELRFFNCEKEEVCWAFHTDMIEKV